MQRWSALGVVAALGTLGAVAQSVAISGVVLDPTGAPVPRAQVTFLLPTQSPVTAETDGAGEFRAALGEFGRYDIVVKAAGFSEARQTLRVNGATGHLTLRSGHVAAVNEAVVVTANAAGLTLDEPDAAQRVLVREELLDANPGRPGAPVSIPGMPIETASGGIKAPQYFVPGVAGDHGEPIAQYVGVGDYGVTNNLSANAHGNGYADPNIFVAAVLGSVTTDGGAFNVLEGNHALNLAATYALRPQVRRFLTLTGDYRDVDLTAGLAPADTAKREWVALEANYGNGLTQTLEHRQQYKWNAERVWTPGAHEISALSIGYFGHSHEGNLVPIGEGLALNDTIDPRQQDQTHTFLAAVNDVWRPEARDVVSSSGYFRTYNLALFSNFGEGLIRQSEFRTVEGAEERDEHRFARWFEGMGGVDFNEDDIHRDNLDHYLSADPQVFGLFLKVLSNDITICEVAPFAAFHADAGTHVHLYAGLRHEEVEIDNRNVLQPAASADGWNGFESPKATVSWTPGALRWLPSASFSVGQGFFTEDPRISVSAAGTTKGSGQLASPLERSHSEQLVVEKEVERTDVRVLLGHTTTTATLAKIDPDDGLADDEGPGTLRFLTASVRHQFTFGMVQGLVSKADARDVSTGLPTPEAPRTIFDVLTTLDRLPWGLRGRAEYEYVGHKLLDAGNAEHPAPYEAIPVGETRIALIRSFLNGRVQLGLDGLIARGYTGQTTETFAPGWQMGAGPPACAAGVNGVTNDFDCGTTERAVGIRMVSWVGGSVAWRFGGVR